MANKTLILSILFSILFTFQSKAQTFTHDVDSFRTVVQEGFDYNYPIIIEDTFQFLKQGFYSFSNYDNTSTFNDIFMCYEPGYKKLPDPRFSSYRNTFVTIKRDIRYVSYTHLDVYKRQFHVLILIITVTLLYGLPFQVDKIFLYK